SLVPIADPKVLGRGPACASFNKVSETQQERRPLRAAVGGELDRLTPVLLTEENDGVVAVLAQVEYQVSADPFRGSRGNAPAHLLVRIKRHHVDRNVAHFFSARSAETEVNTSAWFGDSSRFLRPPACNTLDRR